LDPNIFEVQNLIQQKAIIILQKQITIIFYFIFLSVGELDPIEFLTSRDRNYVLVANPLLISTGFF
jgi:hypothetical protein